MSDDKAAKKLNPKPVAGKNTPAADDIITRCAGGCGGWLVVPHPSRVRGGVGKDPVTGVVGEWSPTPEWVEAEVDLLARGGRRCLSCGPGNPSDEEIAMYRAELQRVHALKDFS